MIFATRNEALDHMACVHPPSSIGACPSERRRAGPYTNHLLSRTCPRTLLFPDQLLENMMGKYLLAWMLGVPTFVPVIAYFFFH